MSDPLSPPESGGDKPPGLGQAEPLGGEVSRVAGQPPSARPGTHTRTIEPPSGPAEPPPPSGVPIPAFITTLQSAFPDAVEHIAFWVGDWSLIVLSARLLAVAAHLRDTPGAHFDACCDVTATDWPPRAARFDVIYSLYSTRLRHRVRLKVRVADGQTGVTDGAVAPSATRTFSRTRCRSRVE